MLDLAETEVNDAGLAHFKGLKTLTRLDLWHTAVTDEGLANPERTRQSPEF